MLPSGFAFSMPSTVFQGAFLAEKRASQDTLLQRIPAVPHLQSAWLILLMCGAPRANYPLRILLSCHTHAFAREHDAADGSAAYWASWADALPMIQERHPVVAGNLALSLAAGGQRAPSVLAAAEAAEALRADGFQPPAWDELLRLDPRSQGRDAAGMVLDAADETGGRVGLRRAACPVELAPAARCVSPRSCCDAADKGIVRYELRRLGRTEGRAIPDITPEALKRLQAYDFPNNVQELFGLIENACRNLPENAEALTAELLWTAQSAQKLDLFKVNLLDVYPGLRDFLRSDWLENLNHGFTKYVFAVLVVLLFVGPQTRDANVGLSVFWAWWWPGILLTYPLLGRFWCAVCPFMIYGEVVQRWRVASGAVLQKWPAEVGRNGGWFLFVLFLGILLWEELWVLENTAYLSSCLLLLITFGAMVGSYFFERRIWCRHLCPIGGMNGLYAKLSLTELRAQNGQCKAVCNTFHCYKGGPEEGEGQETDGCPLYSHPANLKDNKDCVLCFTCLKACPHRNVMLSLRAPGVDFGFPFLFPIPGTAASARHEASAPEVALLFLLLGAVFCHHLPELSAQLGAPELVASFSSHALLATAALLGPGLLVLCADRAARLLSSAVEPKRRPLNDFVELAYSYLPLTWLASLAHWLELGMTEAGLLLPTAARTATFFVPAVGDAVDPAALPTLVFAPAAVALVQGALLLAAAGFSLQLYSKLGSKDAPFAWVHQLMILALTWELWQLIL
ncbi:unnamed protein product [Effrenium voratum]|nr:unnamed protein product [Effrenium voratum]